MLNLIFMIAFIVVTVGILGFGIYKVIQIVKNPMPKTINYIAEIKRLIFLLVASSVSTILLFVFLAKYQAYPLKAGEWVELIIGCLLFGTALPASINSFILHYYAKELPEKTKKMLFLSLLSSLVLICVGLLLLTNAIADYLVYPLVNGISFSAGFVTPAMEQSPNIAWYALCIISGAMLVYFICDHRYYKEYGKHGILETQFFVSFPAGIIGARIGYVIGEWNHGPNSFATRVANGEWWAPFAIWEGGLTIISGAIIGILVGIAFYLWKNRKYSIWLAVDIIVPCILIAQAVGRWGNFFNCEVHGLEVSRESMWWLPKIIANNARFSDTAGWANEGMIYLPLFYIESIANLIGYFIIRFAIGKGLRKYLELGDLAALYVAWYGLTRVIMEPLRHPSYNMGNDGYWSWIWSIIFFLLAVLLIVFNHIVRFIIEEVKHTGVTIKKSLFKGVLACSLFLVISLPFIILGTIGMATGTPSNTIAFNDFNNGIIFLVIGVSFFLLQAVCIPYIIRGIKYKEAHNEN